MVRMLWMGFLWCFNVKFSTRQVFGSFPKKVLSVLTNSPPYVIEDWMKDYGKMPIGRRVSMPTSCKELYMGGKGDWG